MNDDDAIRDAILRHLLAVHQSARSPRSAGIKIRDINKAMKALGGYKQHQVAHNFDYLIQKGWEVGAYVSACAGSVSSTLVAIGDC